MKRPWIPKGWIRRAYLAGGLAALGSLAQAGGGALEVCFDPVSIGPGDEVDVTVKGLPGEFIFLFSSVNPGPSIPYAIVGQLEIGPDDVDIAALGPLPSSGETVFACKLDCDLLISAPIYVQAVSLVFENQMPVLGRKSVQYVVELDPASIDDCNRNGIDDVCEGLEDCDGNGIADICDIANGADDLDGDGVLDACCPELCKLRMRFTYDTLLPDPPFYLSIWIMVPGTNSTGNRIEVQMTDPPPDSATSPNGAVTAFDFEYLPDGGFTFLVDYCPGDPGAFGDVLWFMSHVDDAWNFADISAPGITECRLLDGRPIPSVADPGSFEVLIATEDCED